MKSFKQLYPRVACALAGRLLRQLPHQRCPPGCAPDGCVFDLTPSRGYSCIKCLGALMVDTAKGTCACPAGRYGTTNTCVDCEKGNFCLGGDYTGPNTPPQTSCGTDMTTVGKRSPSIRSCGESLRDESSMMTNHPVGGHPHILTSPNSIPGL